MSFYDVSQMPYNWKGLNKMVKGIQLHMYNTCPNKSNFHYQCLVIFSDLKEYSVIYEIYQQIFMRCINRYTH